MLAERELLFTVERDELPVMPRTVLLPAPREAPYVPREAPRSERLPFTYPRELSIAVLPERPVRVEALLPLREPPMLLRGELFIA